MQVKDKIGNGAVIIMVVQMFKKFHGNYLKCRLPNYKRMNIVILNHCYIIMTWYILIFTIIIFTIAPPGMRCHILPALCCIPRRCCVLSANTKPVCHSCSCSSDSLTGFMPLQQVVVQWGTALKSMSPPPPFNHQTLSRASGCVGMYLGKAMPWAKC